MGNRRSGLESLYRARASGFQAALATVVGGYDEARDIVQDAFAVALRDLPAYRGDGPLEAWVMRIALRLAIRRRQRSKPAGSIDERGLYLSRHRPAVPPDVRDGLAGQSREAANPTGYKTCNSAQCRHVCVA